MTKASHTLLIDHDNMRLDDRRLIAVLHAWIDAAEGLRNGGGPTQLRVRAYGGWFSEVYTSEDRHEAAKFYSESAPSVFRYRDRFYTLSFEFADGLAVAQASHTPVRITHTVVRRSSRLKVTPRSGAPACSEPDCELRATKKWLRGRRACPRNACPIEFPECFERVEQKQVDVHLAVDMLALLALGHGEIALASDDADFLPAIASAALSGQAANRLTVLRLSDQASYLDALLREHGVTIVSVSTVEAAA